MTRHFFALLALITGLAALGSPAAASLAEALTCDASVAAAAGEDGSGETVPVGPPAATSRVSRSTQAPECRPAVPAGLRLPVLMGIERAFE